MIVVAELAEENRAESISDRADDLDGGNRCNRGSMIFFASSFPRHKHNLDGQTGREHREFQSPRTARLKNVTALEGSLRKAEFGWENLTFNEYRVGRLRRYLRIVTVSEQQRGTSTEDLGKFKSSDASRKGFPLLSDPRYALLDAPEIASVIMIKIGYTRARILAQHARATINGDHLINDEMTCRRFTVTRSVC